MIDPMNESLSDSEERRIGTAILGYLIRNSPTEPVYDRDGKFVPYYIDREEIQLALALTPDQYDRGYKWLRNNNMPVTGFNEEAPPTVLH